MARFTRIPAVFLAVPLILLFFYLAVDSLVGDTPTMDEQNHVARGIAFLKSGDPRFSLEHPPLVNTLSALPLLAEPDLDVPFDHPSWQAREGWYKFADLLFWERGNDVERMIFLSRLPIVLLTLGLALTAFHFGREMWGKPAGLFALAALLLEPNILAHGRYSTTDLGGALFVFLSTYMLWRMWKLENMNWIRLAAAGFALGLALGSKLSAVVFLPVFFLLAILPLYERSWYWKDALRRLFQLFLASILGLALLWLIYGFEFGPARFTGSWQALSGQAAIPMPTYWAGIEQILTISSGGRASYLFGEFSSTGWWYYFPVAFLVKTPLLLILLTAAAAVLLLTARHSRSNALFLLTPAVAYFLISMMSALNIGYRHLLPVVPFMILLIGGLAGSKAYSIRSRKIRPVFGPTLLIAALLSIMVIDILLHPAYLSYFNILAGGPANGHKILVDSNLDWGQDLKRLGTWMQENDVHKVKLSWFGTADPEYYGIANDPLPGLPYHFDLWWNTPFDPLSPEPGLYAISASNLWEIPLEDKTVFAWFRDREPDDRIQYSIFIYQVAGDA